MRVAVIGAGMAGLTAAYELVKSGHHPVVFEASGRVGGKLRGAEVAGVMVDIGAEAMLARRPEGVALAEELGLDIVHPTTATSRLKVDGLLKPLPATLMGVPYDPYDPAVAAVLSPEGLARLQAEVLTEVGDDVTVGGLVDARFGPEVTDRLVEPLLGGVYAGRARQISTKAAVPQLLAMAQRGSLLEQVAALPRTPASESPVFAAVRGGMWQLPLALAERITSGGGEIRLGSPLASVVGPYGGVADLVKDHDFDAVVITVPHGLGLPQVDTYWYGYAEPVLATLAFRASDLDGVTDLDGSVSGFLSPQREQNDPGAVLTAKASTFSFAKWGWVRDAGDTAPVGPVRHLRVSYDRYLQDDAADSNDQHIIRESLRNLREVTGLGDARPVDTHVHRWWDGLPQYVLGHTDHVARLRSALPGNIAIAGAAWDGVGIPAVIASAQRAVQQVANI